MDSTPSIVSSSPPKPLRRSTTRVTRFPGAADFEMPDLNSSQNPPPAYPPANGQQPAYDTNGAWLLQEDYNDQARWDADASRLAARKAMAKRQSRASMIQTSRTKSRRKAKQAKTARPGITVDTSVSRHRGNAPKQLFPQKSSDYLKSSGIVGFVNLPDFNSQGNETGKKSNWWSKLGRGTKTEVTDSPTRTRRGDGQGFKNKTLRAHGHDQEPPSIATPTQETYYKSAFANRSDLNDDRAHASPQTAQTSETLQPGRFASVEVSPYDRPITIGLSIPSESLSEHEDYRTNRERSESDVTLVTPNIIVTPAAMKSVWSPDSEPDYRPRPRSSMYSQATFFVSDHPSNHYVPPVPTLPPHLTGSAQPAIPNQSERNKTGDMKQQPNHVRDSTIDSAVTAFEEDDETRHRARITSTGTLFEEDQTPHSSHEKYNNGLSINTTIPPTPRQSRGWWNVITTPFELSRSNSVWTRRTVGNGDTTPDVPMVPHKFGVSPISASTPSTYIWSATEKSPSVVGKNDFQNFLATRRDPPSPVSAISPHPPTRTSQATIFSPDDREIPILLGLETQVPEATTRSNNEYQDPSPSDEAILHARSQGPVHSNNAGSHYERDVTSPISSTTSTTPVLGIASMGTVLMPQEVHDRVSHLSNIPEMEHTRSNIVAAPIVVDNNNNNNNNQTIGHQAPRRPFNVAIDSVPANVLHRSQRDAQTPPQYTRHTSWTRNAKQDGNEETSRGSIPMAEYPKRPEKGQSSGDRFKNCFGRKKEQKEKKQKSKRSRCCCWLSCCCIVFLALVAIITSLAVTLTRKHHSKDIPASSQWLNLTGYPPIPTGMSTIAQPEAIEEVTGCVEPATVWSCALPKEEQASIAPNQPDQPNFEFSIVFDNGTIADKSKTQIATRSVINPVSAGAFVRSKLLKIRDQLTPSPAVPSLDDQRFLGNTTDDNVVPFEGEQTPFYISLVTPSKVSSARLAKRSGNGFSNISALIPPPSVNSDGTAAAATLIPLPSSQPIKLYDRGLPTEHYGFYNYFDRSIFLKSIQPTNNSFGGVPADENGGSTFDGATMRCTWSQTRFRVQIWTNSGSTKPLLQGSRTTSTASAASPTSTAALANDLTRPGSFPYPVTITIDRHGGALTKKMIYCYGMDTNGKIEDSAQAFVLEDRSFGGVAVNPANGPFDNVPVATNQGGPGGIDGGTGGCQCQWANWLQS